MKKATFGKWSTGGKSADAGGKPIASGKVGRKMRNLTVKPKKRSGK